MGKKYYGIKKGMVTGVFTDWNEVKNNISGYSNAVFKGFSTKEEAEAFVSGELLEEKTVGANSDTSYKKEEFENEISIYTDGSFKDDKVGFGLVILDKDLNVVIRDCGRFNGDTKSRNVAGEIYAIIRAIQLIKANELNNVTFYHDYVGVAHWVSGVWKANETLTQRYVSYFNKHMQGVNFRFVHCFAHNGNVWNEEADRLAKLGTTL